MTIKSNMHLGLSHAILDEPLFDLGHGVILEKTYAHLMGPFIMAFNEAEPNMPHPPPWKAAQGGFGFDITAQLIIPDTVNGHTHSEIAVTLLFLIRLWANPKITAPVISTHNFSDLPTIPDNIARITPYEIQQRHFGLMTDKGDLTRDSVSWIKDNWLNTVILSKENQEFRFARDSLRLGQFVPNTSLTIVSLWSALEALFSPSTSELKFRLSALIAAFMTEAGPNRIQTQKDIAKLYDKRSAAAHGKPNHTKNDVLQVFTLLRNVLIKIIEMGKVPSKNDLEGYLFGGLSAIKA